MTHKLTFSDWTRDAEGLPRPFDALWLEAESLPATVELKGLQFSPGSYEATLIVKADPSTIYARGKGQTPYHALAEGIRAARKFLS
jgi:hypothetical protein